MSATFNEGLCRGGQEEQKDEDIITAASRLWNTHGEPGGARQRGATTPTRTW